MFFAEFEAAPKGKLRVYTGRITYKDDKEAGSVKEFMFEVEMGLCIAGQDCGEDIFSHSIIQEVEVTSNAPYFHCATVHIMNRVKD